MIDGQHMTKSITSTTYVHGARVMLTARSADYVVGQHPARSECSASWGAPMSRIAPPDVVVCDDSSGFEKTQRDPLARPVREVVLRMGCVPRREGPRRRQGPVQAPAPQEGEAARTAVPLGPPVHVPRPGASEGRGRSVDQQPHRGDELQAERAAPEAQGHGYRPRGQGDAVVALHAHREPDAGGEDHGRDAHRRIHGGHVREGERHAPQRRGRPEMGRGSDLGGIPRQRMERVGW